MAITRGGPETGWIRNIDAINSERRLRGAPGAVDGGQSAEPAPSSADAVLAELRAINQGLRGLRDDIAELRRHTGDPLGRRADVLSRLPPAVVVPVIQIGFVNYTNTVGARQLLVDLPAPAGYAIVVTKIKPTMFYLDADSQPLEFPPYKFLGATAGGLAAGVFQVATAGSLGAGEFSFRFRNAADTVTQDISGLVPAIPNTELLGWEAGLYRAIVRGGGRFQMFHVVLDTIGAPGVVPDFVGAEVGGYKIPEQTLMNVLNS